MTEKTPQMENDDLQFDEETCERYLLGELSEAGREQFEDAYFADDIFFERFLAVKDELLDAYARGELAEEKRLRFEKHFSATAPRQRQIDETKSFIGAITAVSTKTTARNAETGDATSKSSWGILFSNFLNSRAFAWQAALAVFLLLALGGTWIFVRRSQLPPDEQATQQPTPAPAIDQPSNENNSATTLSPTPADVNQNVSPTPTPQKPVDRPPKDSPVQMASILLLPVASRDISEANTLRLAPDTQTARVSLVFKDHNYRNLSAEITTIDGARVWRQNRLKANSGSANKSVMLQFPSAVLRGQDYIVALKGQTASGQTETINEYYFRVQRDSPQ
jgi:hypothetical protein